MKVRVAHFNWLHSPDSRAEETGETLPEETELQQEQERREKQGKVLKTHTRMVMHGAGDEREYLTCWTEGGLSVRGVGTSTLATKNESRQARGSRCCRPHRHSCFMQPGLEGIRRTVVWMGSHECHCISRECARIPH